jgi:maleylpyruvate isomerase
MNDLDRDIAGAARAHVAVIAALHDLTDDQVGQPSLLPGWTVGHVATHIARNADGHRRMFEAARRGEIAPMYPGGREQRTHDIEAGAGRPARALAADVSATAAALEEAWAAMTTESWSGRGEVVTGEVPMTDLVFIRWREVAVHRTDLDIGYTWADWDADYVRLELLRMSMLWASRKPMGMTDLPPQALAVPPNHRVAWLLGRAEIVGLEPAGIMN